jgi:hypothetical protein
MSFDELSGMLNNFHCYNLITVLNSGKNQVFLKPIDDLLVQKTRRKKPLEKSIPRAFSLESFDHQKRLSGVSKKRLH